MKFCKKKVLFFVVLGLLGIAQLALAVADYSWMQRITLSDINLKSDLLQKGAQPIKIRVASKQGDYNSRLQEVKNVVLLGPLNVLEDNRGLRTLVKKQQKDYKRLRDFLEAIHRFSHFPEISLLGECFVCDLRRTFQWEDIRTTFENNFVDQIIKAVEGELIYAAFGSGNLFPDLRMMLLALERGKKIKAIHVVDIAYKDITFPIRLVKSKYKAAPGTNIIDAYDSGIFDYGIIVKSFLSGAKGKIFKQQGLNVVPLLQYITLLTDVAGYSIDLYIHSSVKNYKTFVNNNKYLKPNCGAAIDFRWSNIEAQNALYQFLLLGLQKGAIFGWLPEEGKSAIDTREKMIDFLKKQRVFSEQVVW